MLDDVTAPTVSMIAVGTGANEYAWAAMSSFVSSGQSLAAAAKCLQAQRSVFSRGAPKGRRCLVAMAMRSG